MKFRIFIASLVIIISSHAFSFDETSAPWIFFDLGDTIIDLKDVNKQKYVPGAKEYIQKLKDRGFKVGLITNIPDTWGEDYEKKLKTLKEFIEKRWTEAEPFNWDHYNKIILPLKDAERKPEPTLFLKGLKAATPCPMAYFSENDKEIVVANELGLSGYLVGNKDEPFYVPHEKLIRFIIETFNNDYDQRCFDHIN